MKAVAKIFGMGGDAPEPEPAKEAPDADSRESARVKSRELQRRKRSGRTSTVLTAGSKLG